MASRPPLIIENLVLISYLCCEPRDGFTSGSTEMSESEKSVKVETPLEGNNLTRYYTQTIASSAPEGYTTVFECNTLKRRLVELCDPSTGPQARGADRLQESTRMM